MPVISWGDFPTWALAVIALLALVAAVAAYFKQADAARKLAEQVTIQRDQFKEQQKANSKQAEVLEAQLREIRQRATAVERQQADAVTLSLTEWHGDLPGYEVSREPLDMALVRNGSHRPIRDVACRLYSFPEDKLYEPKAIAQIAKAWVPAIEALDGRSLEDSAVLDETGTAEIRLLNAGGTAALIFNLIADPDLEISLTLRFTDDAGLYWQIDHDLHLKQLDNRDDW
jgi:hypothetical protein